MLHFLIKKLLSFSTLAKLKCFYENPDGLSSVRFGFFKEKVKSHCDNSAYRISPYRYSNNLSHDLLYPAPGTYWMHQQQKEHSGPGGITFYCHYIIAITCPTSNLRIAVSEEENVSIWFSRCHPSWRIFACLTSAGKSFFTFALSSNLMFSFYRTHEIALEALIGTYFKSRNGA